MLHKPFQLGILIARLSLSPFIYRAHSHMRHASLGRPAPSRSAREPERHVFAAAAAALEDHFFLISSAQQSEEASRGFRALWERLFSAFGGSYPQELKVGDDLVQFLDFRGKLRGGRQSASVKLIGRMWVRYRSPRQGRNLGGPPRRPNPRRRRRKTRVSAFFPPLSVREPLI